MVQRYIMFVNNKNITTQYLCSLRTLTINGLYTLYIYIYIYEEEELEMVVCAVVLRAIAHSVKASVRGHFMASRIAL